MMKKHLMVLVLAAILSPAVVLAPAGQAAAQPEPTLVLTPASGPCDAVVDVTGTGFEPSGSLVLYLVQPGTADVSMRTLGGGTAGPDGSFADEIGPGAPRCDAAALDSEAEEPSGYIVIAAAAPGKLVHLGQRIPGIIAVAHYVYTTTAPPAEPRMVLTPASGPCEAPIRVRGWGFERPPPGLATRRLQLHLVRPGTADISMDSLHHPLVDRDGAFSEWVGMRQHGCEAATLDSQAEPPSGHLVIAATLFETIVPVGERIPDIVATAEYAYTATAPHVPTEALTISPASGPCDAAVQVSGSGFEPGIEVVLKLASPSGEFAVGTLASAVVDGGGQIEVGFSFGALGCRTAKLITEYSPHRELGVGAFPAVYPRPVPPGMPTALATVRYTFTSVTVGVAAPPDALPATGSGPGPAAGTPRWLVLVAPLVGLGLVLVMASLYLRRKRT